MSSCEVAAVWKSPPEIWAYLIVHHAICALIAKASAAADLDPDRISFAKTLRLIRRSATGTADIPP